MSATVLTPFRQGTADQIGPRLFRKQLLPLDKPIAYKGKTLKFDRAYLEQVAKNFNAGAYDQVPAVLADDDNLHNENPENFRGAVKAVEVDEDGLDVVVEMTDKGAELVADNPLLGVSARLVPDVTHGDGERFENVLRHVCLTLKPKTNGTGISPWETVSTGSVLSDSHTSSQTLDFSDAVYPDQMADKNFTTDHLDKLNELPEDQRAQVTALLDGKAEPAKEPEVKDDGKKTVADFMRGILGKKAEKLDDATLEEGFASFQTPEKTEAPEPVALSDDDQRRIDLAEETARNADSRVAAAEWKSERLELASAGVPPAMLDLAEPVLKSGQKVTIDLSDDSKADAAEVIRNLLGAAKGTVDLSDAKGSDKDSEEASEAKDLASDDKWKASI